MDLVQQELKQLSRPAFVMHGGAKGADRLVSDAIHGTQDRFVNPDGIKGLVEIKVPYLSMGLKRGGYQRNEYMLEILLVFRDAGYDCWGMAFHRDIKEPSPGTNMMVKLLTDHDFVIVHVDGMTGQGF